MNKKHDRDRSATDAGEPKRLAAAAELSPLAARIAAVIADLEGRGIKLCSLGNVGGWAATQMCGGEDAERAYDERKAAGVALQDLTEEGVAAVLADVADDRFFLRTKHVNRRAGDSYGLKHELKAWRRRERPNADPYVWSGDFIVGMILAGYDYSFAADGGGRLGSRCYFAISTRRSPITHPRPARREPRDGVFP